MPTLTTISRALWITLIALHLALAILIYVRLTQSSTLHLDLPLATDVLAALVPILPVLAIVLPALASAIRRKQQDESVQGPEFLDEAEQGHRITPLARPVLALLALFDVGLVASALTSLDADRLDCGLEQAWRGLFHSKDGNAMKTIQDSLQCCGFRSTKDMGYPFPDKSHGAGACVEAFGYIQPCAPLMSAQERGTLGVFVGVGVFLLAVKGVLVLFTAKNAVGGDEQPKWKRKARAILPGVGGGEEGEQERGAEGEVNGNGEGSSRGRYRDEETA